MLSASPGLKSYRGFGVPSIGMRVPSGTFYRSERPSDYSNRMLKEKGDPLAQFSGINPENIVGKSPSKEKALKFISGGDSLGSSIFSTAANNIVGFNRANVSPKPSNIQSLIETLSSSIVNNTTKISNIFNGSNQKNTTDRGGAFSFVGGIFDKIKEAFAFISFFGSKKNLNRIKENLETLKVIFSETFEITKALRKAINKIFKQLSGFDSFGGGGGGGGLSGLLGGLLSRLIPGFRRPRTQPIPQQARAARMLEGGGQQIARTAKVAQGGGNIFSRIGNLAKGGGKAALIGGGALAAGSAISGLSAPGDGEIKPEEDQGPGIPGTLLDKFNSILDRFDKILDGLKGGKGPEKKGSGSSSGSGSRPGGSRPGGSSIPSGQSSYSLGTIPQSVKDDVEFTQGITEMAKKYNVPEDYLYAVMGFETGGTFSPSIKNQKGSGATGLIQFMPSTARGLGTTTDALSKMSRSEQLKYVDKYFSGTLPQGASLSDVYMSILMPAAVGKPDSTILFGPGGIIPEAYSQNSGLDLNGDGVVTKAEASNKVLDYLPRERQQQVSPPPPILPSPNTYPSAPSKIETVSLDVPAAQAITPQRQRRQASGQPSVSVINVPSGQQQAQSSSGGKTISMPPPQKNGPDVPFPSPKNPDNFLVFYTRLTCNIIDG